MTIDTETQQQLRNLLQSYRRAAVRRIDTFETALRADPYRAFCIADDAMRAAADRKVLEYLLMQNERLTIANREVIWNAICDEYERRMQDERPDMEPNSERLVIDNLAKAWYAYWRFDTTIHGMFKSLCLP